MTLGSDHRCRLERLVEQTLFGPLDLTIRVMEELPNALDRARGQVALAHMVGKLSVGQGVREVRRRLDDPAPPSPTSSDRSTRSGGGPLSDAAAHVATVDAQQADAGEPVVESSELGLPDYEQLPAAHIVGKLAGLMQSERDAIERYELSHRHRRTILGKLDQLRGT